VVAEVDEGLAGGIDNASEKNRGRASRSSEPSRAFDRRQVGLRTGAEDGWLPGRQQYGAQVKGRTFRFFLRGLRSLRERFLRWRRGGGAREVGEGSEGKDLFGFSLSSDN
jgi:hypothetical protein